MTVWVLLPFLSASVTAQEGFIRKEGEGEALRNGIVVKVSPRNGSSGSILVEQTFHRGGTTGLHLHEHGDELFYVVSGRGTATLGDTEQAIGPELVDLFRAIHERFTRDPSQAITPEEFAEFERQTGGSRSLD